MTPEAIDGLVRRCEGRQIGGLDYALGNAALRLVFAPSGDRLGVRRPPAIAIHSPGIGLLRLRHPLGGELPARGTKIRRGAVIAFLQAGPLMHAVAAPTDGVLGAALREEGDGVGYGDPLFVFG